MTHRFVVPAWARLGTAAVMAAAVLSGCTGSEPDPGPTGATATSPTESATESPTPTEEPTETSALPPLPEEATENTPEGAEAFIRYYFDVVNALLMSPQTGVLPRLSDNACQSCASIEQQIADMESLTQRAENEAYVIDSMARVGGSFDGVTTFNMEVTLPANAILDASGEAVRQSEAAVFTGEGAARWVDGAWSLYGLNLQQ